MSDRMERFKKVVSTGEREDHTPKREAGPFPGHPSVQMEDAIFIADTMTRSKCEDTEHVGEGGEAANKRRDAALGRKAQIPKAAAGSGSWWSRFKKLFRR